jgi:hypothetical protein
MEAAKRAYNALPRHSHTTEQIQKIQTQYVTTWKRHNALEEEAIIFQDEYLISEQWTPDMERYKVAKDAVAHQRYQQCLDHMEKLIVQRFFEMTKLNMSGVGTSLLQ